MLGWSFIFFVFGNHHSFSKPFLSWMSNSLPSGQGDYGFKWNLGQAVQPGSLKKSGKIMLAKTTTLSRFSWLSIFSFFGRSKQDELFSCRSANSESLQISKIKIHFKDTMVYTRGFATIKIIVINFFFFLPTHNACHVKGSAAVLIPNINICSWLYEKFSNCFKSETRSHKV